MSGKSQVKKLRETVPPLIRNITGETIKNIIQNTGKKRNACGKRSVIMKDSRGEFLEKLKVKKNRYQQSLNRLVESQKDNAIQQSEDYLKDDFDFAQREISMHNIYSLIEKKTRELEKIELLIQQISNSETFGLCEECDDPIPPERLLIMPEASLCVPCQRELERFDQMRKPVTLNSSGSVRRRHLEWDTFRENDELDNGPAHSDVDIFSSSEIDEVPYPSLHQEKNPEHTLEEKRYQLQLDIYKGQDLNNNRPKADKFAFG